MVESDMRRHKITFLPMDRVCFTDGDENLLEVAMKYGVHINSSCGGNASCGKCRVKIVEGAVYSKDNTNISEDEYKAGMRLACKTSARSDIVVEIPLESQIDRTALRRKRYVPQILSVADIGSLVKGVEVEPVVSKIYIELPEPSMQDNISDADRLLREIRRRYRIDDISVDFKIIKRLAKALRDAGWRITVTIAFTKTGYKIIDIEPGNKEDKNYSIVIDIGTTTICGQLLDLANCSLPGQDDSPENRLDTCTIAETSDYNAQISYGDDVISRIMYSQKKGGLKRLGEAVKGTISKVIKELLEIGKVDMNHVSHVVFTGNTIMTHLFLGIDPKYIMLSPYTPVFSIIPSLYVEQVGIDVNEHAYVYIYPCVSSYVGGDIVAGVMGSGISKSGKTVLYVDVGTNGEMALGNSDWLMCASCSAGPAFEGGGIKFGMRAGRGAIEQVKINPLTFEPMVLTIGRLKPIGICGSGLIDIIAEFMIAGLIDRNGKFSRDLKTERLREGDGDYEYVLCYAKDTQINRDIVVTEADIDNLIRTKAAVFAGCITLVESAGLTLDDVEMLIIAGGFGHYIDIEKAQTIGLLPELPAERFVFVGNGSLLGARLMSMSKSCFLEAERIAKMMTNIELSDNNRFMEEYVAAMFLPHTNEKAFPGVIARLNEKGRG